MKSRLVRVPNDVYDYFKKRKDEGKSRDMTSDIGRFYRKFQQLRALEKKLQGGRKVLIFK